MTTPLERIKSLVALALNEGASPEESRTAALAAVRLIDAECEIVLKQTASVFPKVSDVATRDYGGWTQYRVTFVCKCKLCNKPIYPGHWAMHKDNVGSLHRFCFGVGMF